VCQSLAGVAGKMGDGAAAAQAAEMALGLRRAKLEEAGRTLVAAEEALAAFTVTGVTEDAAEPTPRAGSEAIGVAGATGGRSVGPATAPPITSPDHARAFGAAAAAKRALAEARRAEVAALANVGAALLKVPATSGVASGAAEAEASEASSEDAPSGTDVASETEDAGDAPRDPSPATRVAAGVARYEEALASLRRDAAGPQDLEMEIGLLLELANAHDNRVGGDAGRARARLARASLRDAVKALTANQREFPNTCTLCSETMDVIEGEGEEDTHASTTGSGPVTCLECLHGYHSACLLRWREEKLVEEMEKMEKAKAEGEDVSGREPQKPRCPDCAKIHASRAAAAEAAQRQPRSSASAPGGFL
jgi:ribosomal protein L37AE/L43A